MVYQRRKIVVLFQKVEILQKAFEANVFERNQRVLSCFIRIFITALQAAGFLFHLIHGSFGNVILFERAGLPQCVAIAISLVVSTTAIPSISLFTFIINGYITGSLFTFENKELIVQRMCFRQKRDNLIEVLPGVETVATYSSSGVNLEFGREEFVWPIGSYLEMLQIHSEAKSIHLIHNSWYNIPLTWLTFNFSLFVPTMVASSFLFQTQALTYIWRVGISLTMLSIVVEVAVCIFISDIFIRDRSLRGVAKVQKEVFTSADQQKKKILSRFVCSSKDEYLESPYWLFESSSSILPFLIDTAVAVERVRQSPVKPSSKETRESDSRSTVPAWDPLSTPSESGKKLPRQFYDVDRQSFHFTLLLEQRRKPNAATDLTLDILSHVRLEIPKRVGEMNSLQCFET
ncbi:hypothetical protein J6590_007796 [Homalodisca vitripennis]|nr:hypothetical protein J6590_007796 [Homalodisca vitripennis]